MVARIEVAQLAVPITAEVQDFVRGLDETMREAEDWAVQVTVAIESASDAFEDVGDATSAASSAMNALGGAAASAASGGITLLLGAIVNIGSALLDAFAAGPRLATEFSGAIAQVQAQTGATTEELADLRDVAEDIFETGLGESFEEAAQAMVTVSQITGETGESLKALSIDALTLSDVFDKDIAESVRAVDQAMTAFGADGQDIFDLVTASIQATGDPADDLLDTINEYAPILAQAGFSAEEAFAILNSGLQAGAFNFDKVGDATKEFFVRLQDGSEATGDALNALFSTPGDTVSVLMTQIDDLNAEIQIQEVALQGAQSALSAANDAWSISKDRVSSLQSALSEAQSELNGLARPNLAGLEEFDNTIFELGQQAKVAQLELINLEQGADSALSGLKSEMDSLNQAIVEQEAALSNTADAIKEAEGAWAASQKVVDDLQGALNEAKRELDELARPELEGVEEFDDKMFDLEQQSKKAQLALLDLEEGSPEFEEAQAGLDAINEEMKRLQLAFDIEFDPQFRALEEAVVDGTEEAIAFEDAMVEIGKKKEEIAGLETAFSTAEEAAASDRAEIERLEDIHADLSMSLDSNKTQLADLNAEFERTKTERLAAAKEELERINTELSKIQLQKEIEFDTQFRALEEAARGGADEVLSFDDAMARIGTKKTEIAGLETALVGAETAAAADAAEVKRLESEYSSLESALGANKDQVALLGKELEDADTPASLFLETLSEGGIAGPEAMSEIIGALKEIEDPLERNQLGAALFGSTWEDLGEDVIFALDPAAAKLSEFEDATDMARDAAGQGLGPAWERLQRVFQTVLADGFEPILATIVDNLVPAFESFATWLDGPGREVMENFGTFISETLGPALENLGPFLEDTVIPALETFAAWILDEGIPALRDLVVWFKDELIPWLGRVADFVKEDVIPALDKFGTFLSGVGRIINILLGPVRAIGAAIGVAAALFTAAKDIIENAMKKVVEKVDAVKRDVVARFGELKTKGEDIWDSIEKFISDTWDDIQKLIEDVLGSIETFISDTWDDIQTAIEDVLSSIETFISDTWDDIQMAIEDVLSSIETFISDTWDDIQTAIEDVLSSIETFISDTWNDIQTAIENVLGSIETFISDTWNDIQTAIGDVLSDISGTISTELSGWSDTVGETLSGIAQDVGETFAGIATAIGEELGAASTTLENAFGGMITTVQDAMTGAGGIQETVSGAWDTVKTKFEDILGLTDADGLRDLTSKALTTIKTAITDVFGTSATGVGAIISTTWDNIRTTIKNAINDIGVFINDLIEAYNDIAAITPGLPQLPLLNEPLIARHGASLIVPEGSGAGMLILAHPGELVQVTPRTEVAQMRIPAPAAFTGLHAGAGGATQTTFQNNFGDTIVNDAFDFEEFVFRVSEANRELARRGSF